MRHKLKGQVVTSNRDERPTFEPFKFKSLRLSRIPESRVQLSPLKCVHSSSLIQYVTRLKV